MISVPVLARLQGLLYLVTGFWPVINMSSFELISGPKTDDWLVKTVGSLLGVIGAVLMLAGFRRSTAPEVPLLATGAAFTLATVDVVYVRQGRISRIYLLDALLEAALIAAWLATRGKQTQ